MTFTIVVS
jgi:hypothetical protein